jgi:protein-tyrosine phosphatase
MIVGTPHWTEYEHETDPDVVRKTAMDLQSELNSHAIPLMVLPGNEAFISPDVPDRVRIGDILTLADRGTHLLLELPYEDVPAYVDDVIFKLRLMNITPVLAHVERYAYIRSDWHVLEQWVDHGCLAQVNAASLDRRRGDDCARDLMDRGLIACTASDAHDATHRVPHSIWNEWGAGLLKGGS